MHKTLMLLSNPLILYIRNFFGFNIQVLVLVNTDCMIFNRQIPSWIPDEQLRKKRNYQQQQKSNLKNQYTLFNSHELVSKEDAIHEIINSNYIKETIIFPVL